MHASFPWRRAALCSSLRLGLLVTATMAMAGPVVAARADDEERPPVWQLAQKIIAAEQLERASNVVFDFMAGVPERRDQVTGTVSRITSALTQPWTPPALAKELRDGLAAPAAKTKGDRWATLMPQIGEWLDLDVAASARASDDSPGLAALELQWAVVNDSDVTGAALLSALSEFMALAHAAAANALSGFSPEQQSLIERLRGEVLTQPGQDRARLLAVTDVALRLTEDAFVSGLAKRLKGYKPGKGSPRPPAGFKKDIVAVVGDSDENRVVLGGRKTSVYGAPAALIIDLGGDDSYSAWAYAQGGGLGPGLAALIDGTGDDTYTCRSVAHAGMAWDEGVGYFFDDEGNGTYRLGGAAQTGVAIFVDGDGKDQYQSGKEGQGGTGASEYHDKPAFALMVDLGGDKDSYSAPGRKDGERIATTGVAIFLDTKAKTLEKAIAAIK